MLCKLQTVVSGFEDGSKENDRKISQESQGGFPALPSHTVTLGSHLVFLLLGFFSYKMGLLVILTQLLTCKDHQRKVNKILKTGKHSTQLSYNVFNRLHLLLNEVASYLWGRKQSVLMHADHSSEMGEAACHKSWQIHGQLALKRFTSTPPGLLWINEL